MPEKYIFYNYTGRNAEKSKKKKIALLNFNEKEKKA